MRVMSLVLPLAVVLLGERGERRAARDDDLAERASSGSVLALVGTGDRRGVSWAVGISARAFGALRRRRR